MRKEKIAEIIEIVVNRREEYQTPDWSARMFGDKIFCSTEQETTKYSVEEFENKFLPKCPDYMEICFSVKTYVRGVIAIPDNMDEVEARVYAMENTDKCFEYDDFEAELGYNPWQNMAHQGYEFIDAVKAEEW